MLNLLLMLTISGSPADAAQVRWIFPPDYPAALQSERKEGSVEFQLTFNPDGRVTGCSIQKSSGTALLDATTCRLSMRRARAREGEARVQTFWHSWIAQTAR